MCRLLLACVIFAPALHAQLPDGYVYEDVLTGLQEPVSVAFDGQGHMYLLERRGRVSVVENGVLMSPPLLDISDEVGAYNDLGAFDLVLDPEFLVNGHFYLSYNVDRHHLLHFGTPSYDPNANEYVNATIGRVTRYTADAATHFASLVPGSRRVLLGERAQTGVPILHWSHGIAGLAFGADGSLLVGAGDGATFFYTDTGSTSGTFYNQALSDGIIRPAENIGAFRAQLLNSHSGKILRLDPATGEGLPSNPFFDPAHPRSPQSKVWSLGLRNPFRIHVRPGTGSADPAAADPGVLYVGDVGWNTFEELHIIDGPGINAGWPIFDGMGISPDYGPVLIENLDVPNPLFDGVSCTQEFLHFQDLLKQEVQNHLPDFPNPCNNAIDLPAGIPTFMHHRAALDWKHTQVRANVPIFVAGEPKRSKLGGLNCPVAGESFQGGCSIGGVWMSGQSFGEPYRGKYFFADFNGGWLRALDADANDNLLEVFSFGQIASPTFLGEDPNDGSLILLDFYGGLMRRIRFQGDGNLAPQAVATADPSVGPSPLVVRLDATGSMDPESGPLEFLWEFEDGSTSSEPSPRVVFNNPGGTPAFEEVELTVTDRSGAQSHTHLHVHLDNSAPQIAILGATNGTQYSNNGPTQLTLQAVATDAEHTPAELDYSWQTWLHHSNHWHPGEEFSGPNATVVLTPTPCADEFYARRVVLTVNDPEGLKSVQTLWLFPDCPFSGSAQVTSPQATDTIHPGDDVAVHVDTTGFVTQVDLFVDGVHVGSDFALPFDFQWTPGNDGAYVLSALAHVHNEGVVSSLGLPIRVHNPTPFAHSVGAQRADMQEPLPQGTVLHDRPILNLGMLGAQPFRVGLHLPLNAPQGAKIVSAHVQFTAQRADSGMALLQVQAEASDDAPMVPAGQGGLSSRPTTLASVPWLVQPWLYPGARGQRQRTPDLAPILQELVNRPGWQSGANVLILIEGFGQRRAAAFVHPGYEAATLLVEYAD